jgi:peptide deformylase
MREIVAVDHENLRKTAARVTEADWRSGTVRYIVEALVEAMRAAHAIALAAPQIGDAVQVAVIELEAGERVVLVNPAIRWHEGVQVADEACLNVAGVRVPLARPLRVCVQYESLYGGKVVLKAEGLMARAICHCLDCFNGIVTVPFEAAVCAAELKSLEAAKVSDGS